MENAEKQADFTLPISTNNPKSLTMNCQAVQNKILTLPDPRVIPDTLREHVAGCVTCQDWAKQAARLESLLDQLPVPPAPGNKKASVVDDLLLNDPVIRRPLAVPVRESVAGSVLKFLDRNRSLVGGLAAAVLVVLGAWWLFTRPGAPVAAAPGTPKHPFLEKIVLRDVALAKASKPVDRLQILGGLAEDLSTEARSLARVATADQLQDMAQWFDKVVKNGMIKQAEKLPVDTLTLSDRTERKTQMLALSGKLSDVAAQAEKMLGEVPPDAKGAFQKIADSARSGEKKLRDMANAG